MAPQSIEIPDVLLFSYFSGRGGGGGGGGNLSDMFVGWGTGVTRVSGFRVRSVGLSGFEVHGFGLRVSGLKVQGSLFFFF